MQTDMTLFEDYPIRRVYDEEAEIWWFSVIDIVQVLTQQPDYQTARNYWNRLKQRLTREGSESVTNCHRLKLPVADGKNYLTDVATAETQLRLVPTGGFRRGGLRTGGLRTGGLRTGGLRTGGFRTGGFRTGGFRTGGFQTRPYERMPEMDYV